jgi:hypothetical protein
MSFQTVKAEVLKYIAAKSLTDVDIMQLDLWKWTQERRVATTALPDEKDVVGRSRGAIIAEIINDRRLARIESEQAYVVSTLDLLPSIALLSSDKKLRIAAVILEKDIVGAPAPVEEVL